MSTYESDLDELLDVETKLITNGTSRVVFKNNLNWVNEGVPK
ncbi:hypothetical protein [Paenibacillus sp. L3-i20]|nr:hypothetical protein [Paenibacillus sp. L3-i20]